MTSNTGVSGLSWLESTSAQSSARTPPSGRDNNCLGGEHKSNFIVVHVIGYYSRLLYLWSLMLRRKRRRRRMKGQIEGVAKSNFSTSQETNHPWILIILTYCRTRGVASVTPIERWCSRDSWSPTLLANSGSTVRDSALAGAGRTIRPSPRVLEVSWQPPRCSSRDNTPLQQTRTRWT